MRYSLTILVLTTVHIVFVEPEKYSSFHYQVIYDYENDSFGNSSNHGTLISITVNVFTTSNRECFLNPKAITDKYIRQNYFQGVMLYFFFFFFVIAMQQYILYFLPK